MRGAWPRRADHLGQLRAKELPEHALHPSAIVAASPFGKEVARSDYCRECRGRVTVHIGRIAAPHSISQMKVRNGNNPGQSQRGLLEATKDHSIEVQEAAVMPHSNLIRRASIDCGIERVRWPLGRAAAVRAARDVAKQEPHHRTTPIPRTSHSLSWAAPPRATRRDTRYWSRSPMSVRIQVSSFAVGDDFRHRSSAEFATCSLPLGHAAVNAAHAERGDG